MRRLILALALYALLSVLDWASTMYVVEAGIAHEANPFMVRILSQGGWPLMLAGKTAAIAVMAAVALGLCRLDRVVPEVAPAGRIAAWLGIGASLISQTAVLVYNFKQLAHIGG
jgi:N-acyl-L-homoserine lactone synthetase